jgi:hypothetical protein
LNRRLAQRRSLQHFSIIARKQPFATGLKGGVFATDEEIAAAEKINASYVGQVLRLTLRAPDIVEAILDARHPSPMTLAERMRPGAERWCVASTAAKSRATLPSLEPQPR